MKRLLLLTFLTFLVAVGINASEEKFGKSESFVKAIHESLSTEHSTWLRNHNAAKSGNPIEPGIKFLAHHNIPSDIPLIPSPEHLVATNQFGVKCDQGYTGDFCNIPVCSSMANITSHNSGSEGEAIELATSYECNDNISFPVDSYALSIVITLYSANGGMPGATLSMLNGTVIQPDETTNPGNDFRYFSAFFYGLSEFSGPGYYILQLSSETIAPCSYQITTTTQAVYDTGFVQSVNDDNIQKDIYQPWRVLKEPMQNTANYLGARLNGVIQPSAPQVVTFYNGDDKQYAPMTLGIRYQCNAPYVSSMYTCVRTDFYKAKFLGYDNQGNVFQRLYMFTCGETNPSNPPSPTPSQGPPDTCLNGGTMITFGQNNRTCLCGMYYTGNQCETKLCFNGGQLRDGVCVCPIGYSGQHCADIYCKSQAQENFDTRRRALVFVVRTTPSFAPYINSSVAPTASLITGYTNFNNPGYFRRYVLVGYANDAISYIGEFDDSVEFQNAIKSLPISATTNNCTDSLYAALSAAVTSESVRLYQKSPIFSFGDNLPDDPQNRAALYDSLGYYKGQIFTILTDAASANCNIDSHNLEYRELRRLAQFTHGLVPYLPVNNLTDTALNIATGVEGMASLATNDFVDQCSLGTKYTTFFVDDSTGQVTVLATGDSLTVTVMSVDGTNLTANSYRNVGNTHLYSFNTLLKGNYLLMISADQNSPCQFRVYGSSRYELFVGVADTLTSDKSHNQPMPFEVTNIVARINQVEFRNPGEVFAEVVVWTNDRMTGQRHVLYAANGNYRDACDYHFIFESFVCTERDTLFYISIYVTDRVGYTVQRVQAGICAVPPAVPTSPQGCQNGGAVDPTNPNGTCICPNGWTGDKCQTINCQNGGTSKFNFCECRAGFTGQFCETTACLSETNEDFSPNRRSLTFVVHDSTTTIQMIQKMQTQMAQVIQDITQQHPRWITQFGLIVFSNISVSQPVETSDPAQFLQGFADFADKNAHYTTNRSCQEIPVIEALYIHLSTSEALKYGIYYVFMNGYMGFSSGNLFDNVQALLETTQSTVNIVQTNAYPCGQPLTADGPSRMWLLTSLTGGQVYVISSATTEKVMKTIPFQYRNSLSYERYYDDCSAGQNFYFPVDSESQTVNILIDGELNGNVSYIHPDGSNDTYMVQNIFNDYSANTRLDQIIGQCDNNWRQVEQRCYRFFAVPSTWQQAHDLCAVEKAILVTIYDQGIEDYLYYNAGNNTLWTALNDKNASGTFVWDQGDNSALPLSATKFTNWGSGQPNLGAGQCVTDNKNDHWKVDNCNTQYAFACVKHVYDADYAPDASSTSKIDAGFWTLNVKTYSGPCAVTITTQSAIQVYPGYSRNTHDDYGYVAPLSGNLSNYIIAHATGVSSFGGDNAGTLQYAHMYTSNKAQTMIQVEKLYTRDLQSCKHQFVSDAFTCPSLLFQTMFTGVDRYGYAFQRINPTLCYNAANMTCANGGVFYDNKCICPPNWGGEYCSFPFCQNGYLAGNLLSCNCEEGLFEGQFCEIARCINGTSNLQPDTNQNKTFILILDGSYTNGMDNVLNNLQATLQNLLTATATAAPGWFVNYIGVVAYDQTYNTTVSKRIEETDRTNFINNIVALATATPNWKSAQTSRSLFTALSIALASSKVNHRSQAYILSAANAEDFQLVNPVLDLIAYSHTAVNTIFIGDTTAPANSTYIDPHTDSLHELSVLSGGGFYQVDPTKLMEFWSKQIVTVFNSYGIVFNSYHNCTSHTSYIQLDGNTNKLIFDVFSMVSVSITLYDANGSQISITNPYRTGTNYLFSISPASGTLFSAGIYQVTINSLNIREHPFCTMNVKGISSVNTYIAYNQDIGFANGQHSNSANYYPRTAPEYNVAVVSSPVPLQFIQAYNSSARGLLWASPLMPRSNCVYNYVSKDTFQCPDASYGIAIDGTDLDGHPFRRYEIVHCVGQQHTVALEHQPHSFITLSNN
jgi:hypothetical protein